MKLTIGLTPQAEKHLSKYPIEDQRFILTKLKSLESDLLRGNIDTIKSGRFRGNYRLRIGNYRIFFLLYKTKQHIRITAIFPRTEKTYR